MSISSFFNMPATNITREFYFNVGGPNGFMRWGIYIFMFTAFFYLAYTLFMKVRIWMMGKEKLRTDYPEKRIMAVIKYVIFQAKVLKESYAGIMHAAMFFGFGGLAVVTGIIVLQEDFTELFFHTKFIYGDFYLVWSLLGDLFGMVVLLGLIMAIYRRYKLKPTRLDTKTTDTFALLLIVIVIISGFSAEALRIAITGMPKFEIFSPFGYTLAFIISWIDTSVLTVFHYINWWVHMIAAMTFVALVGSDKLGHVLISAINVYYQNLENEISEKKFTASLIDPAEFETAETFGISNIEEFSWKDLMDFDACTRCGRCQDNCPAYLTEKPLSPKKIINDCKDNMNDRIPKLLKAKDPTTVETKALIGESVVDDEIWSCTNCGACMENCPVQIEHIPKIIDLRRYQILMEGKLAAELQTSFNNMENNSNPYGFGFAARGEWIPEDLNLKTLAEEQDVDFLYYAGCAASYDKRNQKVAIALVKILQKAGYRIGILGSEEGCCGDSALRGGNEYLFHALASQNLETFKNYDVKKIITTCPHGYNVLKKEYPKFAKLGIDSNGNPLECNYVVYHHTEILADLLAKGQIKIMEPLKEKITYHDSCFLGRYNEIYKAPRDIINSIPGADFVEMSRNHGTSFCCGAGGARMWIEEHLGTRINQFRTKDAQASGATKIGTACPFCLTMLSDGALELDIQNLESYDLAELIYNLMEK